MNSTKKVNIIYWITTSILALFTLPGIFFINSKMAVEGTAHLGIPNWLHLEIGIGAFIGALILITPGLPKWLKIYTYVAFGILYISAFIAHIAIDGFLLQSFAPIVTLALLLISYSCYMRSHPYQSKLIRST